MLTLIIKRRLLVVFCLPFLFAGCKNTAENPLASVPESSSTAERRFPVPPPEPSEAPDLPELPPDDRNMPQPPVEAISAPDIWDVSDVDVSAVDKNKKLIAFTFDDAPSRTLESIATTFASFNEANPDCPASATVFCNGHLCNVHSLQTLQTAYLIGFELGNHTYSHFDLTTLDSKTLQSEIDRTDEFLSRVDGKERHPFRAPFGKLNSLIRTSVQTPILDWSIDTLDWTGTSETAIYNTVWEGRFDGAIVLMHDGYEHTVSALKRLLPALKADGYQVVSVSKLAKANDCPLKKGGVYIRARKQKNGNGK